MLAPFLPPLDFGADGTPRHGAPDFAADAAAPQRESATVHVRARLPAGAAGHGRSRRGQDGSRELEPLAGSAPRRDAGTPVAGARAPLPFPPAPPRTPAPVSFAPSLTETHDTGAFTTFALGAGALGAFLLVLLGYLAPGLQTVRSLPGSAHPDPPG